MNITGKFNTRQMTNAQLEQYLKRVREDFYKIIKKSS